jgi:integrase/recombinase XerD
MPMNNERVTWSPDKLQHMQEQLIGEFAEDTWAFVVKAGRRGNPKQRFIRFEINSPSLKIELKYVCWQRLTNGQWNPGHMCNVASAASFLFQWLNHFAHPIQSLMEKPLESWLASLRSYVVQTGKYKPLVYKHLASTQEYVTYPRDHSCVSLLRIMYRSLVEIYDDRVGLERDRWDLSKMGFAANLTVPHYRLHFAKISQPWLRQLAKQFMQYYMTVRNASSCKDMVNSLARFSRFLEQSYPTISAASIDRSVIVHYISVLHIDNIKTATRNHLLVGLRTFLEMCTYHLGIGAFPKEHLIFDEDLAKVPQSIPRDIPEEVLEQLRTHLPTLDTTILRMVTILEHCGMRVSELCSLSLDCLIRDDKQEWYLKTYQSKTHQEHVIPLVDETVVAVIQAQQEEIRAKWGDQYPYLFPHRQASVGRAPRPFQQQPFNAALNAWAVQHNIRDRNGNLYRFQSHQFRHTLGMKLINEDVPLEVISRLLGHRSVAMTQVYAQVKAKKLRAELERVQRKRKTINYQGQVVKGDPRANDPDTQLVRKGIRGQTLPVGGCGRLIVRGPCEHANKCLTCPMWLTSTEDVPALKSFYARAVRLKQRAIEAGNQLVIEQQEHIIPQLSIRIKSLETPDMDGSLCVDDLLMQLHADLAEAESALEEARDAGLILAAKTLEWTITELRSRIEALEGTV